MCIRDSNYDSPEQLGRLTESVHALRSPPLLIAIDHEGGRVQRCREGFTRLPPMRRLGELWDRDPEAALKVARAVAHLLAAELRACDVDLSFTPVLDLDWGRSSVIGDRSLHGDPAVVVELARALIEGPVSYTHLDVYKRQLQSSIALAVAHAHWRTDTLAIVA